MRPLIRSFVMFLRQITKDSMLYAVCIAPLLTAFFFRFGIPSIEALLCGHFKTASVLAGYYLIFDLMLGILTPFLFCFASSMVILTESDENMARYLAVTPVGKKGYLISRFLFPGMISFVASMVLIALFSLTEWPLPMIAAVCFLTSSLSIPTSLLVVSLSRNRVEGMAISKMSAIMISGLFIPFFLFSELQYLFSILPSFWIAKLALSRNYLYAFPAVFVTLLWLLILSRRFEKKLA